MRDLGVPVNEHVEQLDDLDAVYAFCEQMLGQRHALGYEIDGAVVKVDDLAAARRARLHEQGAQVGDRLQVPARGEDHAPAPHHGEHRPHRAGHAVRAARARVRRADPPSGSRRCTTRTRSRRKDVRVGDTVIVRKAGDVIPEVVGPVLAKRKRGARKWKFPATCPVCAQELVRLEGEANHYCVNADCPAQRVARIVHFASRGAMDIEGLGEERVRQFVDAGLLADAGDVYSLTVEQLVPLERMAPVSAQKLVDAHRGVEGARVSPGCSSASTSATSGRPPRRRCRARARQPRPHRAGDAPRRSPRSTASAAIIADSLERFFAIDANRGVVDKLRVRGRRPHRPRCRRRRSTPAACRSTGSTFVLTGSLDGHDPRRGARPRSRRAAARSPAACRRRRASWWRVRVPGSKLAKAEELGVPVIDEDRFEQLLAEGPPPEQPDAGS